MLRLTIPSNSYFDEDNKSFIDSEEIQVSLNHTLVSASKWESKFRKVFLSNESMTDEETIEYIKMMSDIDISTDSAVTIAKLYSMEIREFIKDPHTATKIYETTNSKGGKSEVLTTELIYYYMAAFGLDISCENWHLARLITLLAVANVKNSGESYVPEKEVITSDADMNERRKKLFNTKG